MNDFFEDKLIRKFKGKTISFDVLGVPPHKDTSFSIRNSKHSNHDRFLAIRKAAKRAMGKIPYYKGSVKIVFHYRRESGSRSLNDYLSGICDSLDGSHGFTFHWSPVVFLDDCQVVEAELSQESSSKDMYSIKVCFL